MVAFTILGRPVYRYGIFYGVTFLFGYWFLWWIATKPRMKAYPQVKHVLTQKKDDLFLACLLGVIVWGRLGHVFLYERSYYSQHLLEIVLINQWGMSFVGWVLGVATALWILIKRRNLSFESMKLLWDLVLCIVPVWIFLWRIGNGLNQELRWKPLSVLSDSLVTILTSLWLTRVYPAVDTLLRVDTNTIQALTEWLFTWILVWLLLLFVYSRRKVAWLISWVFLIVYGLVRYWVEPLKDLPVNEIAWPLSISQRVMILFIVCGWVIVRQTKVSSKGSK
jgi:phosphatidylglycerol:prolipoprotein diacylglycerol transferase